MLTAIPVGFLFGFFLQKGDLCGASAFSEVLVLKDARKIWGLWLAIVTGMAGFALLDLLGWVTLSPKPFLWAHYRLGGVLFGVGMVLTGGCVSGTLYKAGIGHINSIVALLGISIGIGVVEYGPLAPLNAALKSRIWKAADGSPVTISSLTGLPFWAVAAVLAMATLGIAWLKRPASRPAAKPARSGFALTRALAARSWKPFHAGLLIGLLAGPAYLSSAASGRHYPLGVTHGVLHAQLVVTDGNLAYVYQLPKPVAGNGPAYSAPPAPKKIGVVCSVVAGGWFSARLSGQARLIGKPPEQIFAALIGSILVGAGAAFANGCVVGNIMSGVALASAGMVFFTIVVVLANWATTYLYLMGGALRVKR
ncbi:MAG: YeeE/YedE family protein [Bryobacteraceae bacterium]|nr:YeeE/YedE family protein [Bryobacteraceae bacterium]